MTDYQTELDKIIDKLIESYDTPVHGKKKELIQWFKNLTPEDLQHYVENFHDINIVYAPNFCNGFNRHIAVLINKLASPETKKKRKHNFAIVRKAKNREYMRQKKQAEAKAKQEKASSAKLVVKNKTIPVFEDDPDAVKLKHERISEALNNGA